MKNYFLDIFQDREGKFSLHLVLQPRKQKIPMKSTKPCKLQNTKPQSVRERPESQQMKISQLEKSSKMLPGKQSFPMQEQSLKSIFIETLSRVIETQNKILYPVLTRALHLMKPSMQDSQKERKKS